MTLDEHPRPIAAKGLLVGRQFVHVLQGEPNRLQLDDVGDRITHLSAGVVVRERHRTAGEIHPTPEQDGPGQLVRVETFRRRFGGRRAQQSPPISIAAPPWLALAWTASTLRM